MEPCLLSRPPRERAFAPSTVGPEAALAAARGPAAFGVATAAFPGRRGLVAEASVARRHFLDFRRLLVNTPAMRTRVQIAVALFLVLLAGAIAWHGLRPQEREPLYQGKGLRVWLREYSQNRYEGRWNAS